MRTKLRLCLLGLSAGLWTIVSSASAELPKASNAALQYWQAIAALPTLNGDLAQAESEFATIAPNSTAAQHLIQASRHSLVLMRRGAEMTDCHWEVDFGEDGPGALILYLARLRQVGRLGVLKVRADFADQRWDEGIDNCVSLLRLSRHAAQPALEVGVMVETWIESWVVDAIAAELPSMPLSTRRKLVESLMTIPPRVGVKAYIQFEKETITPWLQRHLSASDAAIVDVFDIPNKQDEGFDQLRQQIKSRTARVLLEERATMLDDLNRICGLPYDQFISEIQEFHDRNYNEKTGAQNVFLPFIARAIRYDGYVEWQARTRWQMLISAAISMNDGESKPSEGTDPASGKPFVKKPMPGGFELQSKVIGPRDYKPVTLRVGHE